MSRRLIIISFIIGWLIVSISPVFDTMIVTNSTDLSHLRLGFPLPIIEQHTSLTPMEKDLPLTLGLLSPQENPTDLLFFNYVFSIFILTLTIFVSIFTIGFLLGELKRIVN